MEIREGDTVSIKDVLSKFDLKAKQKEKHPRSRWDELRDELLAIINYHNKKDGFKPFTIPRLQGLLKKAGYLSKGHQDTWGLSILIANMRDSKNPMKTFWYEINTRTGKYDKIKKDR